jgi:ribonuclease-3
MISVEISMTEKDLKPLLEAMGVETENLELYRRALTHSSYANERGLGSGAHNERLEFLGDAVLGLVISELLFARFPQMPEGKLSRLRAEAVREESLARLAAGLNLGAYVRFGRGEKLSGGSGRPSTLADAVEAMLAAVYLDLGLPAVKKSVETLYSSLLPEMEKGLIWHDYKSLVQEYTQGRMSVTPEYRIVAEEGPDHAKLFSAEILLNERVCGSGSGRTKKDAEQDAARNAYEILVGGNDK